MASVMVMLAAAGGAATATGGRDWRLADTGIAGRAYKTISASNNTLHRKAGIRIVSQRIFFHALLDFESTRLLVRFLGDCFVYIGGHGSIRLAEKVRLGKVNTLES